ncbi:MAG TPA: alpha/beta hydrolase [Polyangiaceae bacterium]|nr:alpha/beta hydrolase [Polyangiaceae bacterium]
MANFKGLSVFVLGAAAAIGCRKPEDAARTQPELMKARGPDSVDSKEMPKPGMKQEAVPVVEDPMKHADDDMAAVLAELKALNGKPIESLSAAEARKQPTPTDAVQALLKKQGKSVAPEAVSKVQDRTIAASTGSLPVRIYTPAGADALPVVVYFHGGGFVIADNDVYDATPRALANGAQAIVVSVEYRKAPEHKFPAAHDDAVAAYRWVVKNAASFGGDGKRFAVAGESAGGNLAENVAIAARDDHELQPLHVLLVYPVASDNLSSDSYAKYRDAKPLNKAMMAWFTEQYFRTPADAHDPRISLIDAKLAGLPETTIINAEIDPLRWDGEQLAKKLELAEVPVKQKTYAGVTHEFFGMGAAVSDAQDAVKFASQRLKDSFEVAAKRVETAAANKP